MKTFINPQHLWKYREFDRSKIRPPVCFGMQTYTVDQVAEYLKTHEIEPIELVIIDNVKAIVIDGNHRLAASIKNGAELIPIEVTHMTHDEVDTNFYPATLERFT